MDKWWIDREEDPQLICTTLAQAQELVKLGIDKKTSDMSWTKSPWTPKKLYGENQYCLFSYPDAQTSNDYEPTPCWSVNAMINVLPGVVFINRNDNLQWTVTYNGHTVDSHKTLRDAIFEILKWYLKTTKKYEQEKDNRANVDEDGH